MTSSTSTPPEPVPPPRRALILDKNVLQSFSPADYVALASQYDLLMPDVLFFECLKAEPVTRARCFRALPPSDNPIGLAQHVGHHLQYELAHGVPLGAPSAHRLEWDYRFHEALRADGELPQDVAAEVDRQNADHLARVPDYVERIRSLHRRLDAVGAELQIHRPQAADAIRAGLLDLPTVREFLRGSRDPDGEIWLPPLETLGPDSAIVVHFQVTHALALQRGLDQGREFDDDTVVEAQTPALARELFDADYLILGVLQGGLATREIRLRRIFRSLRPDGALWPPEAPR